MAQDLEPATKVRKNYGAALAVTGLVILLGGKLISLIMKAMGIE